MIIDYVSIIWVNLYNIQFIMFSIYTHLKQINITYLPIVYTKYLLVKYKQFFFLINGGAVLRNTSDNKVLIRFTRYFFVVWSDLYFIVL